MRAACKIIFQGVPRCYVFSELRGFHRMIVYNIILTFRGFHCIALIIRGFHCMCIIRGFHCMS